MIKCIGGAVGRRREEKDFGSLGFSRLSQAFSRFGKGENFGEFIIRRGTGPRSYLVFCLLEAGGDGALHASRTRKGNNHTHAGDEKTLSQKEGVLFALHHF